MSTKPRIKMKRDITHLQKHIMARMPYVKTYCGKELATTKYKIASTKTERTRSFVTCKSCMKNYLISIVVDRHFITKEQFSTLCWAFHKWFRVADTKNDIGTKLWNVITKLDDKEYAQAMKDSLKEISIEVKE